MSILRGVFQNKSRDLDKPEDTQAPASNEEADSETEETVAAALSRLRKIHKPEGLGVAIKQSLHPVQNPSAEHDNNASGEQGFAEGQPQSMWDVDPVADKEGAKPEAAKEAKAQENPAESQVRPRRAGRVRTRLLGVDHSNGSFEDIEEEKTVDAGANAEPEVSVSARFAVGWVVIVDGPGRGHSFPLHSGASQIGCGEDQAICLDFGDTSIAQEGHAMIAYDDETKAFYLGHSGSGNIVCLNDTPVTGTETVHHGDIILIGETSLKIATLCGADFSWSVKAEISAKSTE